MVVRKLPLLLGSALLVGASMASALQPDRPTSERLARGHCYDARDNVWVDLLKRKRFCVIWCGNGLTQSRGVTAPVVRIGLGGKCFSLAAIR